jgi:hypothetical protein
MGQKRRGEVRLLWKGEGQGLGQITAINVNLREITGKNGKVLMTNCGVME